MTDLVAAPEAPAPSNGARKSLVTKLAEVMAAVERVPKRGRNDFHGYNYATEADIADSIRRELAQRHVILLPGIDSIHREPVGEKGSVLTTLSMTFTFLDGDTGEELKRVWMGAGTDKEDKGLYKAMTGGEKYFLLKTFLMPTGDDPERDGAAQRSQEPRGRASRSAPKPGLPAAEIGNPDRPAGDPEAYRDEAQQMLPADRALPPVAESLAAFEAGSRICPSCQRQTIRKGAQRYGGGWFCSTRDGGCGAKYRAGAAPAQPAEPPADGGDDNRAFMVGAIRRKVEPLTPAQRQALKGDFLGGKTVDDATTEDVHRLYLFLGDPQAVKDWWEDRERAAGR